jgi:hypothetical protein
MYQRQVCVVIQLLSALDPTRLGSTPRELVDLLGDASVLKVLSDTMYSLISFRKSTPLQIRQLNVLISNSKQ